ncbi:prepilin-type N-terminal cleavage/methylation domain-containing protein [Bdellovibrio svalbardensis]|uniref:Prepilin-type N-terminal cleavage/methylation domain-containing protein n=1 Tax=Bdellovibrio svalbardensis TaxID=2972972 RepID=A0ABT6DHN0_9BACT|nr:prepilin-type N-terminal cleavage/methylation domain-containing protein [Bdellovibrio svalbardensis]MDG0816355.1 prepilin-type N-terminal cleavage/methylation domain-containing protein [Bdellovibrio svalbardensis]
MKNLNMIVKVNNRGFTAIEVMVGIGLMALVTAAIVSTQVVVSKDQNDLRVKLDQEIDQSLAERIIFSDFNGIEPSYNNIRIKDDNGLSFFDYYPDVPANMINGSLQRTVTVKGNTPVLEVSVVSQDLSLGSTMNYDPTAAYDIGPAPTDFNIAASLNFKSLNKNNWITSPQLGNRPGFWSDGVTLMLDTPAKLRPVVNGKMDMSIPPRSPIFVGYVQGSALVSLGGTDVGSMFNLTNPETLAPIGSADEFLRNAPSIGGGQTLIRLKAIKVIKYYLEPQKSVEADCQEAGSSNKYYHSNLYKIVYRNGKYSGSQMLADKVCSFVMHRDSILKRLIYFKINKVKDTLKENTAGL